MSDNVSNLKAWQDAGNETIELLGRLVVELDELQEKLDIAKILSTAGSIVSGIGSVVCFALAVPTGGIIPGFIMGGFGTCSSVISAGAFMIKHFSEKDLMKKVQNALDKDRRESVLMKRHSSNIQISRKCLGRVSAVKTGIENIAEQEAIKKAQKVLAAKVSKIAASAGCVLNVLIVPLDIAILVDTSIKAKNGSTHEAATKIREIIKQLEDERDQTTPVTEQK